MLHSAGGRRRGGGGAKLSEGSSARQLMSYVVTIEGVMTW